MAKENTLHSLIDKDIDKDILIFTDSMSSCEAIKSNRISVHMTDAAINIREAVSKFKNRNMRGEKDRNVVIGWIPGHRGIEGNEMADKLAKEATENNHDARIKVPHMDWKAHYKEEVSGRTRSRNESEGKYKGVQFFEKIYDRKSKGPWFKKIDAERSFITTINRIRSNHYNAKKSLARKNYVKEETCECGAVEDIVHIVFECEKYIAQRDRLYSNLERTRVPYPYDFRD